MTIWKFRLSSFAHRLLHYGRGVLSCLLNFKNQNFTCGHWLILKKMRNLLQFHSRNRTSNANRTSEIHWNRIESPIRVAHLCQGMR